MNMFSDVYGQQVSDSYVKLLSGQLVTEATSQALQLLSKAALEQGFNLQVVSGYRSFDAQCNIVAQKWLQQRRVLDDQDAEVRYVNDEQWLKAILRFSALPGASRHHWGTDIDVVDQWPLDRGHKLQLTPSEYGCQGVMGEFSQWLVDTAPKFGFKHPYRHDVGLVSPEPWHLSFAAQANNVASEWCAEQWRGMASKVLPAQLVAMLGSDWVDQYIKASITTI